MTGVRQASVVRGKATLLLDAADDQQVQSEVGRVA